jgi:hypothetical protein
MHNIKLNKIVYLLKDPITNSIKYVGEGNKNRPETHIKKAKQNLISANPRLYKWIQSLLSKNLKPIIEIIYQNLSKCESLEIEENLIKQYGRIGFEENGILLNICSSGTYYDRAGKNNPMFGKHLSNEHKLKISIANKKPKPINFSEKMSVIAKSRIISDKMKRAMSVGQLKRYEDPNQRKLTSERSKKAHSKRPPLNIFLITDPDGNCFEIKSIRKFCKEYNLLAHLFYKALKLDGLCQKSLVGWKIKSKNSVVFCYGKAQG